MTLFAGLWRTHMAAAVRGAARSSAQPRVRTTAKAGGAKRGKGPAYKPAKLAAVGKVGLTPISALSIAAAVVAVGALAIVLTDSGAHRLSGAVSASFDRQLTALGLKVRSLTIQGASPAAEADIARASGIYRDEPILHVDLNDLRHRIDEVGWVKSARVVRLLPDTIVIAVTERPTFAVWEHGGHTLVIDNTGHP